MGNFVIYIQSTIYNLQSTIYNLMCNVQNYYRGLKREDIM